MTTGDRIKMVRKQQGMNQTEFAKEIAVSTTSVCQLETGRYNISRTTKHILCTRFHINPDWLETGEGDMYGTSNTAESIVPDLVSILNDNQKLLKAIKTAIEVFSVDDWKKLNAFVEALGDGHDDNDDR